MTQNRRDLFRLAEAALVGLFFVQAMRFLYGTFYARVGSASFVTLTTNPASLSGQLGVVNPADIQVELTVAGIALLVPLLSIFLSRLPIGPSLAAIAVAVGRVFMTAYTGSSLSVIGGIAAAAGAVLYMAIVTVRRQDMLPVCLIVGFAGDQLVRLFGSTMDPTWGGQFLGPQTWISLALFAVAVLTPIIERMDSSAPPGAPAATASPPPPTVGEISGWGSFAMGGLLYLEFSILGLPNTLARRAGVDYTAVAPWLMVATLLPLVPTVRELARRFLAMFDGQLRGWAWLLLIGLLLVLGFRFSGPVAAWTLIVAQLFVGLSWWWIIQPSDGKRNFTSVMAIIGVVLFLLLTGAEFFTFEYAFVRGVPEPFASILRGFRGLGMVVALFAVLLMALPAILARKRLPWRSGKFSETLGGLSVVIIAAILAGSLSRPVVAEPPASPDLIRLGTLNLHSGYGLYFNSDLPATAYQICLSGADVVFLQEVDTGRLTSFGVDQAAWLARQLNMQVVYYPTNEGIQGLAILTRLPIEVEEGAILSGQGKQTGVQFLRLRTPKQIALDVYNTQLSLLVRSSDQTIEAQQQDQTRQIQEIFNLMEQNDPNLANWIIVGGTFNDLPNSDIYQYMIQRGFKDPFAGYPTEKAFTLKLVNDGTARVDYLWARNAPLVRAGIIPLTESTHNMAVIDIGTVPPGGEQPITRTCPVPPG